MSEVPSMPQRSLESRYELTLNLARLRGTATCSNDPDARAQAAQEFAPYSDAHNSWLSDQAEDMSSRAEDNRETHVIDAPNIQYAPVSFSMNEEGAHDSPPLDMKLLGLPRLPRDSQGKPIAVVMEGPVHQRTAVSVILRDEEGHLSKYLLENIGAAQGIRSAHPSWVKPGDSLLSVTSYEPKALNRGGLETLWLRDIDYPNRNTPATIIRSKPNYVEKLAQERPPVEGTFSLLRKGASLVAAAAILFAPAASDPDKNMPITTAHELVQPVGTAYHNGRPQAEQYFDASVLDRTRSAFDAFYNGDDAKLNALVSENGFNANWMDETALDALQNAKTIDEVEAAFTALFSGTPISLDIPSTQTEKDAIDRRATDRTHTLETDVDEVRDRAVAIAHLWNTMDRSWISRPGAEPLQYRIVDDIDRLNLDFWTGAAQTIGMVKVAGYYSRARPGDKVNYVFLSDAAEHHETGHHFDVNITGGRTSEIITSLNPGTPYYGKDEDSTEISTTLDGQNITETVYATTSPNGIQGVEDTAEIFEELLRRNPSIRLEDSVLGEKWMAIMLTMEAEQPGYIASLLSRATQLEGSNAIEKAGLELAGLIQSINPFAVAGAVALGGLILPAAVKSRRKRTAKRYGFVLPT